MAFLEHGTRRLHITSVTANPTQAWTTQQARNLTADLGHRMESLRFPLHDRDGKYSQTFDAILQSDDLRVIKSAPQAPRMNTHCERVIGTIRREVLDHILITGESHAHQVLKTYEDHHNRHRPHQARQHPAAVHDLAAHRPHRTRILDGLINEYRQAARPTAMTFVRHRVPNEEPRMEAQWVDAATPTFAAQTNDRYHARI